MTVIYCLLQIVTVKGSSHKWLTNPWRDNTIQYNTIPPYSGPLSNHARLSHTLLFSYLSIVSAKLPVKILRVSSTQYIHCARYNPYCQLPALNQHWLIFMFVVLCPVVLTCSVRWLHFMKIFPPLDQTILFFLIFLSRIECIHRAILYAPNGLIHHISHHENNLNGHPQVIFSGHSEL